MNSPATSRVGNGGCPGPRRQTELKRPARNVPIDLRRQTDQRMAKVDDLLQGGAKQIVLTIVARLAHGLSSNSESRRQRNHEAAKSGIPKRKKTETHPRLSCKIEYLLTSNHGRCINRFRILHGRLLVPEDISIGGCCMPPQFFFGRYPVQ